MAKFIWDINDISDLEEKAQKYIKNASLFTGSSRVKSTLLKIIAARLAVAATHPTTISRKEIVVAYYRISPFTEKDMFKICRAINGGVHYLIKIGYLKKESVGIYGITEKANLILR